MNIWTDPSFELDSPGLTLEGTATRLNVPGAWPDGDWGLQVTGAPGAIGNPSTYGRARRTLTTTPGVSYPMSVMVSLIAGSPVTPLEVEARTVGGTVLATYTTTTGGGSFSPWSAGSFTATEAQTVVEWRCERPVSGGATWFLDEIEVIGPDGSTDVAIGKHLAMAGLVTALKTINGSPYWTTLDGRVYTRLVLPDETSVSFPYACVPLYSESERIEYGSRHASSKWSVLVHFFTKDNIDSDSKNTATQETCSKWRDDLIRCLMTDQYLATTCKNVEIAQINTFAGGDGMGYSEVVAQIDFWQVFGTTDLGPTA